MTTINTTTTADALRENNLTQQVKDLAPRVSDLSIVDTPSYKAATEVVKAVKTLAKDVKAYWEPLRKATKATYDGVIARRKEMMDPLTAYEAEIKEKMAAYTMEQERIRKAQEEALRRMAQMTAEQKLAEACETESRGDLAGAEAALAEAQVMDDLSVTGTLPSSRPKAQGISQTKAWRITSIDPEKVPINLGGVEIRPVDQAAVMRLIKASRGSVKIPGITYEETVTIGVRA